MGFSDPNLLYLLLLVPLLIILYILRLNRKLYDVPSSILWDKDVEDLKANTPFQRLRGNLLLPLQLLVLVLIIFALSRPFLKGTLATAGNVILLIDTSASMKATDIGESRFASLRTVSTNLINGFEDGTRITLVESGISPKIILGPTSNKSQLLKILNHITPSDTPANINNAISFASSLSDDMGQTEVIIMSDDVGYSRDDLPIRFISFGTEDAKNVGIINFDVLDNNSSVSAKQVFVSIKNFGIIKQSFGVNLYHNNILIDVRSITLNPEEQRPVIFDNIPYKKGILSVSIDLSDDLLVDNNAYYVLQDTSKIKIMLVSEGNTFIEKAIGTSSTDVDLTEKKPNDYNGSENNDIVIFDEFLPDNMPNCGVILVNPNGNLPFAKLLSKEQNPTIINWDKSHQLARFLDLTGLRINSISKYDMPSWMKPLVDSDVASVFWYGESDVRRIMVIPFSLDIDSGSNFVLLPAFPIFISNAISWLSDIDFLSQPYKTGDLINIPISDTASENQMVRIKKPDNSEISVKLRDGRLIFDDTDLVGIYQFKGDDFQKQFAVNLLDETESDIKLFGGIGTSNGEIKNDSLAIVGRRDLWVLFAFLALMILAIEWWVYHRRVLV